MKTLKLHIIFVVFLVLLTACGASDTPYADAIQVYGVVIDTEGKPPEDVTIVVFLDNIEIGRFLSTPMKLGWISCYSNPPPVSKMIGPDCNNLDFTVPRVAEFNQDGSNVTLNLRNIKIGETKSFRSIDGRFLVFQTFEKPPARSLLLLQPDDTVITPLSGTVVVSPTFSARLSPTANPAVTANPVSTGSTPVTGSDYLFTQWIRPLIISAFIGVLVASIMYILLTKKKTNTGSPYKRENTSTRTSNKDTSSPTDLSALVASVVTGTISAVLAVIVQKILGL